jgi:hypothetical protein
MIFGVYTAKKIHVLDLTCSPMEFHGRFGGMYCHNLQGQRYFEQERRKQPVYKADH